eukprot:TRINITY_DN9033_c0_g2_i1.p1 TRINITY_DN9033_c0_g2~~TRINITY_DN9033_c0_g2_i1.p1  ORF type:complete len:307 (+),score=82.02 TRINITY_DN9033_c0_g2_i1:95-1015(+)
MDPEQAPLMPGSSERRGAGGRLALALVGFSFMLVAAVTFSTGGQRTGLTQRAEDSDAIQLAQSIMDAAAAAWNRGDYGYMTKVIAQNFVGFDTDHLYGAKVMLDAQKAMLSGPHHISLEVAVAIRRGDALYAVAFARGSSQAGGEISSNYLMRWKKHGDDWQIDQDFAVRGTVVGGFPPRKSSIPDFLSENFAQAGKDWGVISWEDFANKYFSQDLVAYVTAPGQPVGTFLASSEFSAALRAYSQLPGCGPGHVDWAILDYWQETPTKYHVVGHNNLGPETPPFYHLWEKTATGWKVVETSTSIGA